MKDGLKTDLEAFFKRFPQEKSVIYTQDGSIYFAKNLKDAEGHAQRTKLELHCCTEKLEPCQLPKMVETTSEDQTSEKTAKRNLKKG